MVRLFFGFAGLLLLGLFFLYHTTSQQQVGDLRRCEQHEVALRTQFESEADKVTRLEKNVESGRNKLRAEKELREKTVKDHNLRFTSLQQHYKLLQSEHEDVKTEFENSKRSYDNRIRTLNDEVGDAERRRIAVEDEWRSKYSQLEIKLNNLEVAANSKLKGDKNTELLEFKNKQLTEELNEMRKHCAFRVVAPSQLSPPASSSAATKGQEVHRSFDEQILVSENTYNIPIHVQAVGSVIGSPLSPANTNLSVDISNRSMDPSRRDSSTASFIPIDHQLQRGGIINSVENFQILPKPLGAAAAAPPPADNENVLKEPPSQLVGDSKLLSKKGSSSTPIGDKSLDHLLPIAQSSTAAQPKVVHKSKIPIGVVPIPESMNLLHNADGDKEENEKKRNSPSEILNGRYGNAAVQADTHNIHAPPASQEEEDPNLPVNFLENGNEVENGAHEVNDFNIIEDRNHHDHLQEVLDDEKIVINNNAAEVDGQAHGAEGGDKDKRNEIDLSIINRDVHGDKQNGLMQKKGNDEFVADQGFDDHLEEHVEEEDDDEYPNLQAQQEEGHAVRN